MSSENNPEPEGPSLPSNPITSPEDLELDSLLDDALKDFEKPLPKPKVKLPPPSTSSSGPSSSSNLFAGLNCDDPNQTWSEEFIKEATAQFEQKMREYIQKGSGSSDPVVAENLHKVVDAASKGISASGGISDDVFAESIQEAIKNISQTTSSQNPLENFNENDLTKLMSSFGMADVEDSEMDEILPFMTNMMQKLLSKDLLQPVLVDIVERYPDWLADNQQKLPAQEFEKYNKQYEYMKKICEEYAAESPSDPESEKQKRFDRISELMLKVQCSGPPPKELTGDMNGDGTNPFNMDRSMADSLEKCSIM